MRDFFNNLHQQVDFRWVIPYAYRIDQPESLEGCKIMEVEHDN